MGKYNFNNLIEITKVLRGENGCPWDREQTHESLKTCLLEECYETIEAINNKDSDNLCEELGDVLLQVALHTAIAEEKQEFNMTDVTDEICKKMIRRHPHVFSDTTVQNTEDVLNNWEEIKRNEKKETTVSESVLKIPKALPSCMRTEKVQKKVAKIGLDYMDVMMAFDLIGEELKELKNVSELGNKKYIEEKFGDLLFAVINLSRFLHVNAENSLTNATDKFINRFVDVEKLATSEDKSLDDISIKEQKALWGLEK